MGFEKLSEELDNRGSKSLYDEVWYHNTPTEDEYYGLAYMGFEDEHQDILSQAFTKAEGLAERHPEKEKILKILDGYKNKISAYKKLYFKEYDKMMERGSQEDRIAFDTKYHLPYQKALTFYQSKYPDIKKELMVFDKDLPLPPFEKENTAENGKDPQLSSGEKENTVKNTQEQQPRPQKKLLSWLRKREPEKEMDEVNSYGIDPDLDHEPDR